MFISVSPSLVWAAISQGFNYSKQRGADFNLWAASSSETWSFQGGQKSVQMLQNEIFEMGAVLDPETFNMPRNQLLMGGAGRQGCQTEEEIQS